MRWAVACNRPSILGLLLVVLCATVSLAPTVSIADETGGSRSSTTGAGAAPDSADTNDLQRRNNAYSIKGWEIRYPSQADTLLQDAGGIRSALDKYGFGFIELDSTFYGQNLLPTPLKVPQTYAPSVSPGAVAAGRQVYSGERPTFLNASGLFLVYDASRLGVPDGQIVLSAAKYNSTWQPLAPNLFSLSNLSYYQSLLNRKLEVEIGIVPNTPRFVGSEVGGGFASTFGPAASIHVLLGMGYIAAPAVNIKYNATNRIYDKASVQLSSPVNGMTGNPIYDASKENPTGLSFSQPGRGVFVVNEFGYRNDAAPGDPQTWLRVGGMYNSSRFKDFSKAVTDPTATIKGNEGIYVLGDRQIWQLAPGSRGSAYRGLYVGGTFEYAPPRTTPVSQYYEARIYSIGPVAWRPTDIVSFVYTHQVFSSFLADQVNPVSVAAAGFGIAVPSAYHASNATTVSYLAHLRPGLYASMGLGYTDHPSTLYFRGEGSALNVLANVVSVF